MNSINKNRRQLRLYSILLGLCLLLLTPQTQAHKGPPYPLVLDKVLGPYKLSVWGDPDIGTGTFYIVFESTTDGHSSDDIKSVKVGIEPVSGRLEEKMYTAVAQHSRNGARYTSEVHFDKGEFWNVRVIIEGDGFGEELHYKVEATPDGSVGFIGIFVYAVPFVVIGFLWFRAMMKRREVEA